jgi:hypothetical protein
MTDSPIAMRIAQAAALMLASAVGESAATVIAPAGMPAAGLRAKSIICISMASVMCWDLMNPGLNASGPERGRFARRYGARWLLRGHFRRPDLRGRHSGDSG